MLKSPECCNFRVFKGIIDVKNYYYTREEGGKERERERERRRERDEETGRPRQTQSQTDVDKHRDTGRTAHLHMEQSLKSQEPETGLKTVPSGQFWIFPPFSLSHL